MNEIHSIDNIETNVHNSFDPDKPIEKIDTQIFIDKYDPFDPDKPIDITKVRVFYDSYDPDKMIEVRNSSDKPLDSEPDIRYNENIDTKRQDDINNQNKAIDSVETGKKELNTTQEKGNYGEMKTDADLRQKGYDRISNDMVTSLDDSGHQGIDGVYYNPDGKPPYIIADAKYGSAQLSETADGKQMSEKWIDNRLDVSVGKEKADEIRLEKIMNPDNVGAYVAHVDEKGNVTYDKLDMEGNVSERNVEL